MDQAVERLADERVPLVSRRERTATVDGQAASGGGMAGMSELIESFFDRANRIDPSQGPVVGDVLDRVGGLRWACAEVATRGTGCRM